MLWAVSARAAERPNIVLIFIDDLGYGDISPFHPECAQPTPELARMAEQGMRLEPFYAAPVCTPSRAQVLTGCYAPHVSLPSVLFPAAKVGIHPDERTIAEELKGQGYATGCFGKWHLGDQPEALPTHHGFDTYYGVPYSNDMQFRNGSEQGKLAVVLDDRLTEVISNDDQSLLTERYTERAIEFMREHRGEPFFVYLPHTAVHVPLYPGKEFIGRSENGKYGDWVVEVDASVGRILETLRSLELAERTLVIFTTDNGPWLARGKDGGNAGPLRGGKGGTYEGGVRVPTIAWWPGKIAPGSRTSEIAGNIDLLPTFVALAGGQRQGQLPIDGRDLSPLLLGQTTASPRSEWYYFSGNNLQAVRSGPWKLAVTRQSEGFGRAGNSTDEPFMPTLYNLEADLGETTNVIDQHPEVAARLRGLIAAKAAELAGSPELGGIREPARYPDARPLVDDALPVPAAAVKKLHELTIGDVLPAASAPRIAGRAFSVACEVEPHSKSAILVAHGGTAVGWVLHLREGRPAFTVRAGDSPVTITAREPLPKSCRLEARLGRDGGLTLLVDGQQVAAGQATGVIPKQPAEDLSIGFDSANPVDESIQAPKYKGGFQGLTITLN
ncbi:MAG: sulfatase-like hydrolase/transferase [Planctomycetaceae bacterium]